MFIATANSQSTIQGPLRDRMEIIEVNGYTLEEKIEIAKRHLLPKQISEHGISKKDTQVFFSSMTQSEEKSRLWKYFATTPNGGCVIHSYTFM
jgi:ATP-dependent Lon protease